jgi:hypothetical protein
MIAPGADGGKRFLGGQTILEHLDHIIVAWFGLLD